MHIGFTGTRALDRAVDRDLRLARVEKRLLDIWKAWSTVIVHHGDCVGFDEWVHDLFANRARCLIMIHPPTDRKHAINHMEKDKVYNVGNPTTPLPYLERNRRIVNNSSILIAFPKDPAKEVLRSGTWSTVRYARQINCTVEVY